jgi:hypothetical protein
MRRFLRPAGGMTALGNASLQPRSKGENHVAHRFASGAVRWHEHFRCRPIQPGKFATHPRVLMPGPVCHVRLLR